MQSGCAGAEGRARTDYERASSVSTEALHQGPGAAPALAADLQTLFHPDCSVSTQALSPLFCVDSPTVACIALTNDCSL